MAILMGMFLFALTVTMITATIVEFLWDVFGWADASWATWRFNVIMNTGLFTLIQYWQGG